MIEHDVLDAGLGDADDDDFDLSEVFDSQLPDNRYLDRELSWLAFNQRVLELAEDPALPVLERANFLAIFASNLDEFFMVRVAGLKRRIITGLAVPTNVGRSPQDSSATAVPSPPAGAEVELSAGTGSVELSAVPTRTFWFVSGSTRLGMSFAAWASTRFAAGAHRRSVSYRMACP